MRGKEHVKYLWIIGILVALFALISFFVSNTDNVSYVYNHPLYTEFEANNQIVSTSVFKLDNTNFNEYVSLVKNACDYNLDPTVIYDVLIAESSTATYISFFHAQSHEDVCTRILSKSINSENDAIVAMVHQQPIYLSTVQQRLLMFPEEQRTNETAQQILQGLIDERLLLEEARVRNVTISIQDLDVAYGEILKQNNVTDNDFIAYLTQSGIQKEDYLAGLSQQMIVNKMLNDVIYSHIEVTDQEIGLYYTQNPELFKFPQRMIFRQILFNGYDSNEALVDDINAATDALTTTDFCELVQKYSHDEVSKESCGIYDASSSDILPQLRDALFAHNQGDAFLVQSPFGYHLVVLDSKDDFVTADFESVKENIRVFLLQQKSQELYGEYIRILRAQERSS